MLLPSALLLSSLPGILAINFKFEEDQLTEADTKAYAPIRFGGADNSPPIEECRYVPGDEEWPSISEWAKFNESLGGVLLKPKPLAHVCYEGPDYDSKKCSDLKAAWTRHELHMEDPTSIMTQWPSGSSCVPTSDPTSNCTQGGWPTYVVNATSVRHIQAAVNFARNQNIRLVVKNTGHDINGKAVGGFSLSVWTHNIKHFEYHPNYEGADYTGKAVSYSAGYQAFDGYDDMAKNKIYFINAGGQTVGIAGGFLQGAGHSTYTSYYGLAADRVINIQAVTADGRFVKVDAKTNPDLFWAFRGGGGSTFGIITSVTVQAFSETTVASGRISFTTAPNRNGTRLDTEIFWKGVRAYWNYCLKIVDEGGLGYNFIRHTPFSGGSGYTFEVSISLPGHNASQYRTFIRPLLLELRDLGIDVPVPNAMSVQTRTDQRHSHMDLPTLDKLSPRALGDNVSNSRIASRLFLKANHATPAKIDEMSDAIREVVQTENNGGGYTFHGINYNPNLKVSGNPNNAIHPAYRETVQHAQAYESDQWWDGKSPVRTPAEQTRRHNRLQSYLQKWRDITPGSGSYINEGDAQEPDWKDSFWGSNYPRLLSIKKKWDPSGIFYAISGVGSDQWVARGSSGGGYKGTITQDGRLCRAEFDDEE